MDIICENTFTLNQTAICLGKFDGVHAGHRKLLACIRQGAKEQNLRTAVFTFQLHPGALLGNGKQKLLTTLEEKIAILKEEKMDTMIAYPFTKQTASMEPETFVEEILCGCCDAKWIVVGEDFRFGKGRKGDVKLLQQLSQRFGYQLQIMEKVEKEGRVVSSTYIRECVEQGEMELAGRLLCEPYRMEGVVVQGNQMGRTLDMPTANLVPPEEKLLPPFGVYAVTVELHGKRYEGITNVGKKPTIEGENQTGAETHLFAKLPLFYGETITVYFHHFLRPERKFPSLVQLREQMQRDVREAKEFFYCGYEAK